MARDLRVSPDSTFCHTGNSEIAEAVKIKTSEISRISFKNRKKGAVEGLIIGALTLIPTAILSNSLSDDGEKPDLATAILNGGLAGVIWGAGIGAFVGSRVTYVFISPQGNPFSETKIQRERSPDLLLPRDGLD